MPPDPNPAASPSRTASPLDAVKLGDRWEVLPGSPLPAFNSAGGNAFATRPLRDKRAEGMAVICAGTAPPRYDVLSAFVNAESPIIGRLLDWGVVDWPADRQRRFALLFERPGGRRLWNTMSDTGDPVPEEALTRLVVVPMLGALRELSGRGVVHGAIRPTNFFFRDLAAGTLMLGDGVSTPSGFAQPAVMETIERGMCTPSGRGHGSVADDLYAFGVTLLMLALGRNPVAGIDDEQVLNVKIERGSLPALLGQVRLPLAIGEAIRGLLVDDPKQRWTVNDLDLWVSGRRLSPKQPQVQKRAARPLEFGGQEHWYCRSLARALARQPPAAAPMIESGELDKWMRRSLGDEARADAVASAVQSASGGGKGGTVTDRLVARVAMALDPPAPIRYRARALMPDGIGTALAEAFLRGESPQLVAEFIANQFLMFWVNVQSEFKPEYVPLVHLFDQLRSLLDRTQHGLGLERVLYEMNPQMPCLSPLVAASYPLTPADLLRALDWKAAGGERNKDPIDRHVSAFLAARHKRTDEMLYTQLGQSIEPMRRVIAMLNILADVQVRTNTEALPHLASWIVALIEPAIRRFHSRPHQAEVRKQVEVAAHAGRLAELLKIVDDPEAVRSDKQNFENAVLGYREADAEIEKQRSQAGNRQNIIDTSGRQMAAITSSILSILMVALIIFLIVF